MRENIMRKRKGSPVSTGGALQIRAGWLMIRNDKKENQNKDMRKISSAYVEKERDMGKNV